MNAHFLTGLLFFNTKGDAFYTMPGFGDFYRNGHFAPACQKLYSLIFTYDKSFALIQSEFSKTDFWQPGKKCCTKTHHPFLNKLAATFSSRIHDTGFE